MDIAQPPRPAIAGTPFSIERTAQRERIRVPARLQVGQTVFSLLIGTLAMGTGLMQLWPGERDTWTLPGSRCASFRCRSA